MEVGARADQLRLVLQHDTPVRLSCLQVVEGWEHPIGHPLVGERPQAFTGLQFGRVGWQEEQMNAFGHHQLLAGVPASSIQHQQDPFALASSDSLGELRQSNREHFCRDRGQQEPLGPPRGRMHKAKDVHPLIALPHGDLWPRPLAHPHAAQDGFETDTMLIGAPQLDGRFRKRLLQSFYLLRKVFLKAS
jgi:hypothetical protein